MSSRPICDVESTASHLSVGLSADIAAATNTLSEQLDNQRDEELRQLIFGSSATYYQQIIPPAIIGFRKIGFGQCGLIFERPGREYVVKVAKQGFKDALMVDYQVHQAVYAAFCRQTTFVECRVPKVIKHIPSDDAHWWEQHGPLFAERHGDFPFPSSTLISERILPLPKIVRSGLISRFCEKSMQHDALINHLNRDCLARIYLGKSLPPNTPLQRNFSLRNFNFHLDQMLGLKLPVEDYARAIGDALAIMHWDANVDGYDVEFVLGSEAANAPPRAEGTPQNMSTDSVLDTALDLKNQFIRIWLLDFNLCSRWEESIGWEESEALIDQLVIAFFENDPYYPLPLMENVADEKLWSAFRDSYLAKSEEILAPKDKRLQPLPANFIASCVAREQANLERGLGHGHRELKG
ncbi:zinc finger protein-domain-containing protein [Ilyonectria destructans]|nr:zinc finger protein-domain-containing protein [Ilyonectria destructans]